MAYAIKEIFYSIQGEGAHAGRAAVFCRFSGCNLWSGREEDRQTSICQFCDTDFLGTNGVGGGMFQSAKELVDAVTNTWPNGKSTSIKPYVVCTGGEPLLQLDYSLIETFHKSGFEIAVETNGTMPVPEGIDWLTISPKAGTPLLQHCGNELKLVFPQSNMEPKIFEHLAFEYYYLQPMYGPNMSENMKCAVQYCLKHPQWRISLQMHKILDLP